MHRDYFKRLYILAAVLLVLSFAGGFGLCYWLYENQVIARDNTPKPIQSEDNQITPPEVYHRNIFADIAEKIDPAVVKVTAYVKYQMADPFNPFFNDPFFREFFGDDFFDFFGPFRRQPELQKSFGSGFIVTPNGYIVTNEHVVHEAEKIEVAIKGSDSPVPAEVSWVDYSLDLAVLKVATDKVLPTAPLGDSQKIRPGDWVIAIGNPYELEHTVTVGVISALGRPLQIPDPGERRVRNYRNLIQTDAAINPGNSGGPLVNIAGQVIGINTAVNTRAQGIGFAIPINELKDIIEDLKEDGRVTQPWIGIVARPVNQDVAEYFGLKSPRGLIITTLYKESPAHKAGLQLYDIILEVDGEPVNDLQQFDELLENKGIGSWILLKVLRENQEKLFRVKIIQKPVK